MALQFPQLQTRIARRAVSSLEEHLHGNIEIDRIAIVFINKVMAYGISITGEQGDTLASLDKLSVSISPKNLLRGQLHFNRIFLQDGCFNLIQEGQAHNNINRIFNIQPKPDSLKKPFSIPDMTIDEITLRNMSFSMSNPPADTIPKADGCINFKNLELRNISARINRISIESNTISCRIRDLSCIDRCGYGIESLSGTFSLDSNESRLDNLHLVDSWSEINADYISFGYNSGKDLNDFIHKIRLGADLRNSVLDFRSIGVFAESLRDNHLRLSLNGKISGPVSELSTYDLEVSSENSTSLRMSAVITGLPDIRNTHFNMTLKHVSTSSPELSDIISAFSGKKNNIGTFLPDKNFSLTGIAYGSMADLYSIGTLNSGIGSVTYEAEFEDMGNSSNRISSNIWVDSLDIGDILNNSTFGDISLDASLNAEIRTPEAGGLRASIEKMNISSLTVKEHEYKNISVSGGLEGNTADIRLLSHEKAFPAMFQSIINLREGEQKGLERIRIYLDIPYADLLDMNLVHEGSTATAGVTAKADLQLTGNSILGNVLLDNISYSNDNGQYHIDSIYVRSALSENRHTVTLRTPFLQAGYTSTDSPVRLIDRLKYSISRPALERLLTIDSSKISGENGYYNFHLQTYDMSQICDIIMPGLHIADSTTVDLMLDKNNLLDFKVQSSSIAFRNKKGSDCTINDILLNAGNRDAEVKGNLAIGRILLGNITLDNTVLSLSENGQEMLMRLGYNNADSTWLNLTANINAWKNSSGQLMAEIAIDSSAMNIRNHSWVLSPTFLSIGPREYTINGFGLFSAQDSLRINGSISDNPESALSLRLANLNLDLLNSFTTSDLDIQGRLSGEVDLFNFFSGMGANMEISGKGLKLKGEELGEISILSRRDLARNRFNLLINNYILGENPINISGYFIPGRNYLDADLRLENFSLTTISPFLADIMDISGGYISGDIGATGQLDMLMLSSENSHIDSMAVTPVFTQVPYIVSGPITMSRQRIELDSLSITDPDGATAMLAGSITHDFFKNIYLDANLNFNEFQVLNTQEIHNEKFYGTAYASGQVGLSGFTDNLQIDAQVTTAGNSSLHIPLSSSSSASTTDLISYTDFRLPADSTVLPADIEGTEHIRHRGNIEIRATAGVTSGTELQIEIDKQLGDILRCNGNGNINLTLNPSRNIMDLRGDYTINEGSLHYTLYMQSRDFTINEGGTIAFNGDLKNTNLNVGATYSTKASISTLIADTTSVGNRRNVNCGIQIQGSLTNPELSFSIDIPDLDPITKGRVESALSTPDKVQKQFMALLISGSFVPDEQSGIINNSTILYSNASEMLSNQFNNIFRQLDIPLDLGLNYQPGGSNGSWGMFDVAVSYQAFNNRLIINGNVGNDETSSNWAGDFDAEIKVDRQGKLRVTLFTRSADSYSNYLDNTQRSGFGVTYQDEFDTFGDFWRNIFFTRKRREQYELQQLRKAEEEIEKEAAEANIVKEEILRPRENPMNFLEETGSVEYQEQEQENQIYYYKEEEEEETVRAE